LGETPIKRRGEPKTTCVTSFSIGIRTAEDTSRDERKELFLVGDYTAVTASKTPGNWKHLQG